MGERGAENEAIAPRATYVPEIDGLRAVAVLAVVAFHGGLPYAKGGFLGVSLFFTLSGFLITRLLIDERHRRGRVALGRFWERRLRRLAPAALLTIVAVVLLAPHFADSTQRASLRGDALGALAYGANWRFLEHGHKYADVFGGPSPLLHFWSLAIEEQFYIVFPLLVAGVFWARRASRRALGWVLGGLLAGSIALQLLLHDPNRVYLGTDTRAAELLAGALLAAALHGRVLSRTMRRVASGCALAAFATFAVLVATANVGGAWLGRGGLAGVALCNVALVGAAVLRLPLLRPLAWPPVVAIGAVSYGIYLFHWPVFVFLTEDRTGLHGAQLAFVRLAIVAVVTVISYHFLECPIRHRRVLVTRPRLVGVLAIGIASSCFVALTVNAQPGPKLVDPSVLSVVNGRPLAAPVAPPPPPAVRVMVVGDETGSPFARALARRSDRFRVDDATEPGCPIVRSNWTRRHDGDAARDTRRCAGSLGRVLGRAQRFKPDTILVMNTAQEAADHADQPPRWQNAVVVAMVDGTEPQYQWFGAALRGTGAAVVWADVPYFTVTSDPAARGRAYFNERVDLLNGAITRVAAANSGVTTLDFASHVNGPFGTVDLRNRPDGTVFSDAAAAAAVRGWFTQQLLESRRAARGELGQTTDDPKGATRVLVAGDSTSLNIAAGLMAYGRDKHTLVVEWAGKIGCPVVHAAEYRMVGETPATTDACTPFTDVWAQRGRAFKPDVVLIVTSFTEASDFRRTRGARWSHLGEADHDAFVASEFDAIADAVAPSGAKLAWTTAPYEEAHQSGDTPVLNRRLDALNAQLQRLVQRRPQVTIAPLRERVGEPQSAVDRGRRPDGIHFTVPAGREIADRWLARFLIGLAHKPV